MLGTAAYDLGYDVHQIHHNPGMNRGPRGEDRRCNCRSRGSDRDDRALFCQAVAHGCRGSRHMREDRARQHHKEQAKLANNALRDAAPISHGIALCYNMVTRSRT